MLVMSGTIATATRHLVKYPYNTIPKHPQFQALRGFNSNSAGVCKVHRLLYTRTYPTTLVLPDGASIVIRFPEPRSILKLPLDLATLSETERRIRLGRRKPKQKVKIEEDIDDDFDASKYVHLIKK